MESQTTEGMIGIDWISKDDYIAQKTEFFDKNKEIIEEYLQNNKYTKHLNPDEIKTASRFLLNFRWSATLICKLSNYGQDTPAVRIGIAPDGSIGFDTEKGDFIFDVVDFIRDVKFTTEHPNHRLNKEERYEIVGVEEMAHCLYFEKKREVGDYQLPTKDEPLNYLSSDVEYRAKIWQTQYAKHYMSDEVYTRFKFLLDAVSENRKSLKNKHEQ